MGRKKILIFSSYSRSLINFRFDLIKELKNNHNEIICFGPKEDIITEQTLKKINVNFSKYYLKPNSLNPIFDIISLFNLWKIIKSNQPALVFAYTIKPVIFSSLVTKFFPRINQVSLISGLGYGFNKKGFVSKFLNIIISLLFKYALNSNKVVFFQNSENLKLIKNLGFKINAPKFVLVNGSGVNTSLYKYTTPQTNPITFLFVGRLIKEKGILDFINAAERLKNIYDNLKFQVVGYLDIGRNSLPASILREWVEKDVIEYLGFTNNVSQYINKSSIFVLPTYYNEGLPRSILEAMSIGRGILTTDTPGCKETVKDGENGFLIQPKNVMELKEKMEVIIQNPEKIISFGKKSREIAVEKFDVKIINKQMLNQIYQR